MDIRDFLQPSEVTLDMRASDKVRLLKELARQAAVKLNVASDGVTDALLKREELGSTGTGGGIAIPHARLAGVKSRSVCWSASLKPLTSMRSMAIRSISLPAAASRPYSTGATQCAGMRCANIAERRRSSQYAAR